MNRQSGNSLKDICIMSTSYDSEARPRISCLLVKGRNQSTNEFLLLNISGLHQGIVACLCLIKQKALFMEKKDLSDQASI